MGSVLNASYQRYTQHLFVNIISTRLATTVGICIVFILSKTYSPFVCQHYVHKTCHDCWHLHCIHPIKDLFTIYLSTLCPQDWPWLLGSALYSSFQRLIEHLFVSNLSIRFAMTVGVCTIFILSNIYTTTVCQQHFYEACHDCLGLHSIHHIKDVFNICLSTLFPQDLPRLLVSALYSSYKRLIQHLFVTKISTRLVLTVGVCTVFIISKTYSTFVCHQQFYKTCHHCWGLHCIHNFKDLFNICLTPTFPQDFLWLLGTPVYSSFQRLIQHLFVSNISTRLSLTVGVSHVFILSKTYSTWGLYCMHPIKEILNICLSTLFPQDLPRLLGSALYSSFQRLIQHLSVNIISTRPAKTVGVCTLYIL